jgi:acetyl esterase/lipase
MRSIDRPVTTTRGKNMMIDYELERDIAFGTGGGRELRCDVYRPARPNGAGVLMLHGGGWRQGSKAMLPPQAAVYCRAGFTCVASAYRLTPEAPWPAQIHDVKAALRWFRAEAARLGVEPARIAAHGNSAGAHLALLLAGTPGHAAFEGEGGNAGVDTSVAAVVAVYPPVGFSVGPRASGFNDAGALLGREPDPEVAHAASPMSYVTATFPPTFLLHGTADKVVPVSASINLYTALSKAGGVAEMHIYAQQPHGWARRPAWVEPTIGEAVVFLERYLVDPDKYAREAPAETRTESGHTA